MIKQKEVVRQEELQNVDTCMGHVASHSTNGTMYFSYIIFVAFSVTIPTTSLSNQYLIPVHNIYKPNDLPMC